MRGRRIVGPTGPPLTTQGGRGGPVPLPPEKQKPVNPPVQLPAIQWPSASGLTSVISQGIGEWTAAFQVAAGLLLIFAGLMLAVNAPDALRHAVTAPVRGGVRAGARLIR